jgi:hypothetical protein
MTEEVQPTQPVLPPNKIAFVIDGKVVDVFHTDDRLAAILLSGPVILDVASYYENKPNGFNVLSWEYDGSTLTETEIYAPMEPSVN